MLARDSVSVMRGIQRLAIAVIMASVLAGCAPLISLLGDDVPPTEPAEYVAGDTVTSPDGVVTITLPQGWFDLTEAYVERTPDTVLAAFWSMDEDLSAPLTPFATVSHHAPWPGDGDVVQLAEKEADEWMGDLGGAVHAQDEFTTDAGGTGAWIQVLGEDDGLPVSVHVIVVEEEGLRVQIFLESYPVAGSNLGSELVGAAVTLELDTNASASRSTSGQSMDGLYSDGTYTLDVPEGWTRRSDLTNADIEDIAIAERASLAGFWFLREPRPESAESAWLVVWREVHKGSLLEAMEEGVGPVGTTESSEYLDSTVVSLEELTLPGGRTAARACLALELKEPVMAAEQCYYILAMDGMLINASIEANVITSEDLATLETVLVSVRPNE